MIIKDNLCFMLCMFVSISLIAVDYKDESKYGNKTANLAKIDDVIQALRKDNVPVSVPAFFGISHDEIQGFLGQKKALDGLMARWGAFKKAQRDSEDLTNDGKEALERVRGILTDVFNENDFAPIKKDRALELDKFLKEVGKIKSNRLMVRSTGREDTKEMANAGGNESLANISIDIGSVSKAMGKVLKSYFSEKSFQQRIAAGESLESLFQDPFMPVLLQLMIGEKEGGEIPSSGVAFSREPFANTKNIVAIDATFGHGEAVVNGVYPGDSFFVTKDDSIYPVLRYKHSRLKPKVSASGLEPARNSSLLRTGPSLSKKSILHIKKIALELEGSRDESVDIEFTVLDKTIFILQVRPIVEAENKPSYLSQKALSTIPKKDKLLMTSIVSGGSELKHIRDSEQIIISEKIQNALDIYLNMKKRERERVSLVISGQNAPINSHEATTFRANNKPVMYVKNFAKAQEIISSASDIVADGQRGLLLSFENFDFEEHVNDGWLKHPVPRHFSLHPDFFLAPALALQINHKEFFKLDLGDLLSIVRDDKDEEKVKRALQTLRFRINDLVRKALEDREKVKGAKILNTQLKKLLEQFISQSIQVDRNLGGTRLERLFAVNFLEALLGQATSDREIILPLSIFGNLKGQIDEQSLAKWLGTAGEKGHEFAVQYAKLARFALNDEVKNALRSFLINWHLVSEKNNQAFAQMLRQLVRLDIAPLWLNLPFFQAHQKFFKPKLPIDSNEMVKSFVQKFESSSAVLTIVAKYLEELKKFPWINFGIPKKFDSSLKSFEEDILNKALDDTTANFKGYSNLEKAAVLALLHKMVARFDDAVKTQSRSSEYRSDKKKALHLYKMLDVYFKFLDRIRTGLLSEKEWISLHELNNPKIVSSKDRFYLPRLKGFILSAFKKSQASDKDAKEQMERTSGFNAAGAKLTSKTLFDRSTGRSPSLEDMFTLIHQNLLVVLGFRSSTDFGENFPLPPLVKDIKDRLLKRSEIDFSGLELNNEGLTILFNETLRNHSNAYEVVFDFATKKMRLKILFLGFSSDRWPLFASITRWILPLTHDLKNNSGPFMDDKRGLLEIDWRIDRDAQVKNALNIVGIFREYSNYQPYAFRDGVSKRWPKEIIGDFNIKSFKTRICFGEFWHRLNNNSPYTMFFENFCNPRRSRRINKIFIEPLRDKIKELASKGRANRALQFIQVGKRFIDISSVGEENYRELYGILLNSTAIEDWNRVTYGGENILFILVADHYPQKKLIAFLPKLSTTTIFAKLIWDQQTIVHKSAELGMLELMKFLLTTYDRARELVSSQDASGNTVLHLAIKTGDLKMRHLEMIKFLVVNYPKLKEVRNQRKELPAGITVEVDPDQFKFPEAKDLSEKWVLQRKRAEEVENEIKALVKPD